MSDLIPYAKQSLNIDDFKAVEAALKNPIITRGDQVSQFEAAVAKYCKVKYAVAFNTGSTALSAAYHAAEVSVNDRILSSANTFVASVGPGIACGAQISFVDLDPETGNPSINAFEKELSPSPSRGRLVLVPVHYSGITVNIQHLESMLKNENDLIIEDAAHALGSEYPDGSKVGNCQWSNMTMFSFHPAKTITTGEGGMITTNDKALYLKLQSYRNNGITRDPDLLTQNPGSWYYEVHELTGNYNVTDFQAALGLSQLKKSTSFIEKRRKLISEYRRLLKNHPFIKMSPEKYSSRTAYHLCSLQIDFENAGITRKDLMEQLRKKNIGTQVHYIPIYHHPFYKSRAKGLKETLIQTEKFYSQALSLPLFPDLRKDQVQYICQTLLSLLKTRIAI